MRLAAPLAMALLALSGAAAHAQPAADTPPTVTASGKATVKRAPDRAFVTFATETRAARPEEAQKENARAMEQVRRELASQRIPDDAIQTTSFNLREDVDWVDGKRVPRGYVVTNAIEVRVDAMETLGELLDEVVKAGATSVGGIRFDLKNRDSVERQALRLALADARARAEAAAAGVGARIVGIRSIEEQGTVDVPRPMAMRMEMAAAADAGPQTPVSGGEIEIVATVRLTAILDPR